MIVNGFQPLTVITKHFILDVAAALDVPLIPDIILFTWTIIFTVGDLSYARFFTLILSLIVVPFLSPVIFSTIKFTSARTWDMLCNFLWFICRSDHIKCCLVYVFYFMKNTYCTKQIFNSITTSTKRISTNNKWTVIKFISIQINRCWANHAWLII